ncbi:MAG: DUF4349 domain-containing protein [Patescibacteria group bacterium]|jgi:hypothetical protein
MPPSSSSVKRPGIWAWIGFGLVVLLTLGFLKMVFVRVTGYPKLTLSDTSASGSDSFLGRSISGIAPAMPPIAQDAAMESSGKSIMPYPGTPGGSASVDLDGNAIEPRIIKTGDLSLRVMDAPKAVESIRSMVTAANGFVESSSISDSGEGPRTAWVTVRIPVDTFEATIAQLKSLATLVLNENLHGQDVTSEFVDLEADLRNAKAEEASYLEILKRSGDIEDVLAVTQRLAEVRGRIERLEGRKRYLENRTDLATLSVSVTEETRVEAPSRSWRPGTVLREAMQDLVISLQDLANFVIRALIAVVGLLLPIALLTSLVIWIGFKIVRAIMRRMGKK